MDFNDIAEMIVHSSAAGGKLIDPQSAIKGNLDSLEIAELSAELEERIDCDGGLTDLLIDDLLTVETLARAVLTRKSE